MNGLRAILIIGAVALTVAASVALYSSPSSVDGPDADPGMPTAGNPLGKPAASYGWGADELSKPLPREVKANFDVVATLKPMTESAANTDAGIVFHYKGAERYAFVRVTDSECVIGAVKDGNETILARTARTSSPSSAAEDVSLPKLKLRRRGRLVTLAVDDRLAAAAYYDFDADGEIRMAGAGDRFSKVDVQRTPSKPPVWEDDFMRAAGTDGNWSCKDKGRWRILSGSNPSLSANPFAANGRGENTLATAGEPHWHRYTAGVSLRGPAGGRMGFGFAFRDNQNGYLLRWSSSAAADSKKQAGSGVHELIRLTDGNETVLAKADGGYRPGQWYRVDVDVHPGRAAVRIDGRAVFSVRDDGILGGKIALWSDADGPDRLHRMVDGTKFSTMWREWDVPTPEPTVGNVIDLREKEVVIAPQDDPTQKLIINRKTIAHFEFGGVTFDDAQVRPLTAATDQFDVPAFGLGGWTAASGAWSGRTSLSFTGGDAGVALFGADAIAGFKFGVQMTPGSAGSVGIVFHWRDQDNHDALVADADGGVACSHARRE